MNNICKIGIHDYRLVERFYGDLINHVDARSCWRCEECGGEIMSDSLYGIIRHRGFFETLWNYFKPLKKGQWYVNYGVPMQYYGNFFGNIILVRYFDEKEEGTVNDVIKTYSRWNLIKGIKYNFMDISSTGKYPSNKLSNFAANRFFLDGNQINSMEGFLQGLKFENIEAQKATWLLVGNGAKKKGAKKEWFREQTLYYLGEPIKRNSERYQEILDMAYETMYNQCDGFRRALSATGNSVLCHSLGKKKITETVLTRSEFCGRLTKLRDLGYLREENNPQKPLF